MAEEKNNMEELFQQIDYHLLHDERPSEYLEQISKEPWFMDYPFSMLGKMKETPQSKRYHPEGSVWNHTMMVVDQSAEQKNKSKDARILMWAALLHDIGKPVVTKIRKDKITAYNHDSEGEHLTEDFLSCFSDDAMWIGAVAKLVRYHMHILYVTESLPFGDIEGMKRETDIDEVALLGLCDRIGRGGSDPEDEAKAVRLFLKKMRKV
ncbi:HDIG domain-containing protein [Lacrimispora sphenoides]|jgi:putative nucleotidyltransferase with HDIG domain|uniref:HD domain-containing protein n=1 Tax=Lacrimispora sphenoides TaxID=29370 RepID=UPI0008D14923|nr:HD domain-containing protein [Lacrimispora sphenoides]SEU23548.1 HDIG domain-containing protein [Lacrimispora sphenoides]